MISCGKVGAGGLVQAAADGDIQRKANANDEGSIGADEKNGQPGDFG